MRKSALRGVTLVLSLLLFCTTTILLTKPAATAYEVSLYGQYSLIFWTFLTGIPLIGISALIFLARPGETSSWLKPLLVIFVGYLLLFAIPEFRGYFLFGRGGADVLAHLGEVKTIQITGHVSKDNYYPTLHLFLYVLQVFDVPKNSLPTVVSTVFFISFSAGTFLLVRRLSVDRRLAVLSLACSTPLIFTQYHRTTHPFLLSFLLVPTLLYLVESARLTERSYRYLLLAFFFVSTLVFFHPETITILVVILTGSVAVRTVYTRIEGTYVPKYNRLILPIVVIPFFLWYSSFPGLTSYVQSLVMFGLGGSEDSRPRGSAVVDASSEIPNYWRLIVRFIELFGSSAIFFGLAGITVAIVLIRIVRRKDLSYLHYYATVNFAFSWAFAVVLLFGIPLFGSAIQRVLRFPLFISVLLNTILLSKLVTVIRNRRGLNARRVAAFACIALLIVSVPLSIHAVYPENYHHTHTEHQGSKFFIEHEDESFETRAARMTYKTETYIWGAHRTESGDRPFRKFHTPSSSIPDRIGYANHSTVGETFDTQTYLITKEHDLEFYKTEPRREWGGKMIYGKRDLARLALDRNANEVYANGGFSVWTVE